jgi:hypothetical protein
MLEPAVLLAVAVAGLAEAEGEEVAPELAVAVAGLAEAEGEEVAPELQALTSKARVVAAAAARRAFLNLGDNFTGDGFTAVTLLSSPRLASRHVNASAE